jgi:hypothetical protein
MKSMMDLQLDSTKKAGKESALVTLMDRRYLLITGQKMGVVRDPKIGVLRAFAMELRMDQHKVASMDFQSN